ncbi:MAG: hypothetical protein R2864_04395 [Syntrophotaleaceae bacterium]
MRGITTVLRGPHHNTCPAHSGAGLILLLGAMASRLAGKALTTQPGESSIKGGGGLYYGGAISYF